MLFRSVKPYWNQVIEPELLNGKNILITAHGNSLRAITMIIEKLSPEEIMKVEIPTGQPILYVLGNDLDIQEKRML
mgnify:FL=1